MPKKTENDIVIKTARYGSLYVMRYGSPRPEPIDPIHKEPIIPTPRPNPGPVRYGSPRPEPPKKSSKLKRIIDIIKEK